jgi:hypothetical protein
MSLLLFDISQRGCAISVAADASAPERFAAEELQRYLAMATGGSFPIVHESDRSELLVGEIGRTKVDAPALSEDGYLMRRVGEQVVLLGDSPRATLYAVYHFLETLGFRWLEPGDDAVPALSRIEVGDLDMVEEPVYTFRSIVDFPFTVERMLKEADWAAKNRLNWVHPGINHPHVWEEARGNETVLPEILQRGLRQLWGGHTFQTWIPNDVYFDAHPEYFALVNGERIPQQNDHGSLCLSNPAMQREVAQNILRFSKENPGIEAFDLWMNDTVDWCECEACRRFEGEDDYERYAEFMRFEGAPQRSRAYFTFVNNVARMVREENPDIILSPLAYARSNEPPDELQTEPNVFVGFTNFLRTRNKCLLDPDDARNTAFVDTIKRWQRHAKNLFIYEYFSYPLTYNPFTEHLNNVADTAAEMRYYPTVGIRQCSSEGAGEGYWRPMVMYAYGRLLWNPEQPHGAIIEDFCRHAYGEAAELMLAFWQIQEAREPFLTRRDKNLAMVRQAKEMTDNEQVLTRLAHLETLLRMPDRITQWPDGEMAEAIQGLDVEP